MDDEKNFSFILLTIVCSITIFIEVALFIWSNNQVSLVRNNINTIELAGKGVVSFFTLGICSLVATSVSIISSPICVPQLHAKISDHKYYIFATFLYATYIVLPLASTLYSIYGGYSLLKEANISLFAMIALLL